MKIKFTKRFLLSLCLMTLTLLCGGNKAWGQTTSTLTFTKACGGSGTANDEVKWTVTSDAAESDYDKSRGIHYGTSKKAVSYLQLSTSGITGVVKKIVVNASGASETSANLVVTVNRNSYGNQKTITSTAKDYTFEGTGSGEIIVKLSQTSAKKALYVKSISVTYQEASTPTLEYTVSWKVNDADYTKGAPTTKVADGSSVTTLPTVPSDIAGKTFVGWTNAKIATSSATAPPTLFTKAANAPAVKRDVTYYAVFASASGTGESSEELTEEEIVKLGTLAYKTEKNCSGAKLNYSIFGYKDGANRPWIQLKNDKGVYIKITAPSNITKMDLKISGAKNSTGGIEDISKHDAFSSDGKVGLVTEDCSFTTTSENIGLGSKIVDNLFTIATTSESKVVYLKVSTGARIWGITTYFSDLTYSNYVTTVPLTFSDEDDLTASLPTFPLTDQTFTLNRNVYKGWNTFCVPFKLTQAQLEKAYGNGAVAKYLSGVTTDGAAATLHFTPEEGGGIKANKAYLLYLTADVTEAKTFSGVTLEPAGTCTTTVTAADGGDYTFQGILTPTALETNDRQYFLNSTGTSFVLPLNDTSKLKATRAYIIVPTPAGPAQSRQYNFDFNGTTTAIDKVTVSGMEDGTWYTISGIRVNRPAAKGVYIHNGRKVIVK